jgi:hypothetical protein
MGESMIGRLRSMHALPGCAVGAVLLIVYFASGPLTLPDADAGEFAAVAVRGGIPHPPGYPLLVLLLQAFVPLSASLGLIPALSLSAMLCAVCAAGLLTHVLLREGMGWLAASLASAAVFLTANVWRAATTFEPFALNLLLAAMLIGCCQRWAAAAPACDARRWPVAIGVLFGLGLCNHHSLAMMAPLPLAVMFGRGRARISDGLWMGAGFVLGALPLLAFGYMRHQPGWIWGDWSDFPSRLVEHLLRREYGTLTLAPESRGHWSDGPLRFFTTLPGQLSYALLPVVLLGLWFETRRQFAAPESDAVSRSDGFRVGLLLCLLTTGVVLPALFGLGGSDMEHLIGDRFLALPTMLLAFPLASGLQTLGQRLPAVRTAAFAALLVHAAVQWPLAARRDHTFYEAHLRNIVATANDDAVIMTVGDQGFAGGLYLRHVLGHEGLVLVASGINWPWYRTLVAQQLGRSTARKKPLYLLDRPRSASTAKLPVYPVGPLLRVVEQGMKTPTAREQFVLNEALFARLELPRRDELDSLDAWEADEMRSYARTWNMIGTQLHAENQPDLSRRAFLYRDHLTPSRKAAP